jgi:hypothetical protein
MSSIASVLLKITGDSDDARQAVIATARDVAALDGQQANVGIDVDSAEAQIKIGRLTGQLDELGRKHVNPEVSVRAEEMIAELAGIEAVLLHLDGQSVHVDVDVRRGALEDLHAIEQEVTKLFDDVGGAGGGGGGGSAAGITELGGDLGKLGNVASTAGGVIIATLVPALAAIAASAVAAVGGIVVLANAFAAALGPAVLLVVGVVTRIAAVLKARQAVQQADTAATRAGAQATNDARAAEERRYQATLALRDAREGVTRAEDRYRQAVQQARDAIVTAARAEVDAHRHTVDAEHDVANATGAVARAREEAAQRIQDATRTESEAENNLATVTRQSNDTIAAAARRAGQAQDEVAKQAVAALRAWGDAQREVRDAALGVEDAQLGVADAQDRVKDSTRDVTALLKQMGATDPTALLKSLSSVDPSQIGAAIAGSGLKLTAEQTDTLGDALRGLAHANLDVKKAGDDLTDAQKRSGDAQDTLNGFTTDGINAYEPYRAAVQNAADAQDGLNTAQRDGAQAIVDAIKKVDDARIAVNTLTAAGVDGSQQVQSALDGERRARERLTTARRDEHDAEHELARLRDQGIRGAPQVIAASQGIRDASEQLARAHHQAAQAQQASVTQSTAAGGAAAIAAQKVGALSGAERELLRVIDLVVKAFRVTLQPATDAVIGGLAGAARTLLGPFQAMRPLFTQLGRVWGSALGTFAGALVHLLPQLEGITRGTIALSRIGSGAIVDFITMLIRFAAATMPLLVRGAQAFADMLHRWAGETADTQRLRDLVGTLVSHLSSWLRLAGALGDVFVGFLRAAAPFGQALVDWLTRGVQQLGAWMNSARGQNAIASFFRDTLPLAKSMVTLLAQLGRFALIAFQTLAPIVRPAVEALAAVVRVINDLLVKFPILREIIVAAAEGPLPLLIRHWNAVKDTLAGVWGAIKTAADSTWNAIKTAVLTPVDATASFVRNTFGENGLAGWLAGAWSSVKSAADTGWNAIKTAVTAPVNAAASLVRNALGEGGLRGWLDALWDGIRSVAERGWGLIKGAVTAPVDAAASLVRNALGENGLRGWLEGLWGGIKSAADAGWGFIKSAVAGPVGDLASAVRNALGDVPGGLRHWLGSLWDGIKGDADDVWSHLSSGAEGMAKGVAKVIGDFLKAPAGIAKDIVNSIIDLINHAIPNKIHLPGPAPDINLPDNPIPHLAAGALVRSATFALLGEGTHDEAVLPLSTAVLDRLAAAISARLNPLANLDLSPRIPALAGAAAGRGAAPEVHRHFHIPPGPGVQGGFDPMFAAVQLDQLLRDEGLLG